jgi:hypothetical protein
MKPSGVSFALTTCLLGLLLIATAAAEDTPPPAPGRDAPIWDKAPHQSAPASPVIQKIGPGVLQIGNIVVNKPEGFVRVPGAVNMREGLVEYLACGTRGKLHESVLMLDVDPYALQIALLLLGLEPGNKPIERQGASTTPAGDPIEIWVTWQDAQQKTVKHRAEDLLLDKKTDKPMPHTRWVFTGSTILDGKFMAGVEQSIAATYHDPFAILDHTLPTGADDTIYFANPAILPPKGTEVAFTIRPAEKTK